MNLMNLVFPNKKRVINFNNFAMDFIYKNIQKDDPILCEFLKDPRYLSALDPVQIILSYKLIQQIKTKVCIDDKELHKFLGHFINELNESDKQQVSAWLENYYK